MKVILHEYRMWLMLTAVLLFLPCENYAEDLTPEEAYNNVIDILKDNPDLPNIYNTHLYSELWWLVKYEATTDSMQQKILELQWSLLAETDNNEQIRRIALQGFRHQPRDSVKGLVKNYLDSTNHWLRTAAAEVSIEFGDSTGIDILLEEEVYDALVYYNIPKIDSLIEVSLASASPLGRMQGALQLELLKPSDQTTLEAINVLDDYADRGLSYSDDSNLKAAVVWGFFFATDTSWAVTGTYIENAIDDSSAAFRIAAMTSLRHYVSDSVSGAWDLLESLIDTTSYDDVRDYSQILFNEFIGHDTRYFKRQP